MLVLKLGWISWYQNRYHAFLKNFVTFEFGVCHVNTFITSPQKSIKMNKNIYGKLILNELVTLHLSLNPKLISLKFQALT